MSAATALHPVDSRSRLAVWALFLGAALISFSAIFVKASELGPLATGFHRMFLALPVFGLWMALEGRSHSTRVMPRGWGDWRDLALCGLFLAADLAVWHVSIRMTSAANATLLGGSAPIYVTLVGWLFFGQRFRPLFLFGLALSLVGAALLLGVSFELGGRSFLGDLMALSVGSLYAGYIVMLGRLRRRFSTATVMAFSGVFTCLALLPLALIADESLIAHSLHGWLILFGLAWLSQVAGQSSIAWSLAHLPAAFGALVLLATPVATAVFAWILLGEAIAPLQALGGLIVLAGIALARQGSIGRAARRAHGASVTESGALRD
jgi:drug/metabolite transporter (DMT)-like permease